MVRNSLAGVRWWEGWETSGILESLSRSLILKKAACGSVNWVPEQIVAAEVSLLGLIFLFIVAFMLMAYMGLGSNSRLIHYPLIAKTKNKMARPAYFLLSGVLFIKKYNSII